MRNTSTITKTWVAWVIFATATVVAFLCCFAILGSASIVIHSVKQRLLRNRPGSDAATSCDFLRERLQRAFTRANQLHWTAQQTEDSKSTNLPTIWNALVQSTGFSLKTQPRLVTSYILSRLDYCNRLLMGTPNSVIQPLQKIQNFAARLVLLAPHHHHSTPLLEKLHWLPISERINSLVCVSVL